jgi:hypothetical protein
MAMPPFFGAAPSSFIVVRAVAAVIAAWREPDWLPQ